MDVTNTRFGTVTVEEMDLLHFEHGLIGLEQCRSWVLLADGQNESLGWLQNIDRSDVAVAIVSPRLFVPDYQLRMASHELSRLHSTDLSVNGPTADLQSPDGRSDIQVVVIVSRQAEGLSLNLKAPLVINVQTRHGSQVVSRDEYSVRHPLMVPMTRSVTKELRKIA